MITIEKMTTEVVFYIVPNDPVMCFVFVQIPGTRPKWDGSPYWEFDIMDGRVVNNYGNILVGTYEVGPSCSWARLTVTGFTEGETYLIEGSGSVTFVYTPQTSEPLATPTNLHTTNVTSTGARLHWNSVENAEDYKVEYRQYGQTNWTEQN